MHTNLRQKSKTCILIKEYKKVTVSSTISYNEMVKIEGNLDAGTECWIRSYKKLSFTKNTGECKYSTTSLAIPANRWLTLTGITDAAAC
jgi:hypothetical protein